jgi:hypothetical protein
MLKMAIGLMEKNCLRLLEKNMRVNKKMFINTFSSKIPDSYHLTP